MWRRRLPLTRRVGLLIALAVLLALAVPASRPAEARSGSSEFGPAGHDGYYWLDYFRAIGGLGPVSRDAALEAAVAAHVEYLANHALACETDVHDELTVRTDGCGPNPAATAAGRRAGQSSDVTRVNGPVDDAVAVQNWFSSGFHALTLLDPRLRDTGYAAYYTPRPAGVGSIPYPFTAAVDVYHGRTGRYRGRLLTFPARGSTSPLLGYRIGSESPEPFRATLPSSPCHAWTGQVSAPIIVQWPVGGQPVAGPAAIVDLTDHRPLPTCALTAAQYPSGSLAAEFLLGTNRVTQAAFYYAATPFRSGHRYQLLVGRTVLTDFRTTDPLR